MTATVRFTEEHEWVSLEGDIATVGITNFAQEQLGDVVFVELPEVGRTAEAGEEVAVVESVKAASEIYTPLEGEIVEVNEALAGEPTLVNSDPTGEGWFFKVKVAKPDQLDALMDEAAYNDHIGA